MRFKIDENLPAEIADMLRAAHHDAMTVTDEGLRASTDTYLTQICTQEDRILVTLDVDFADLRRYPPQQFPGFIVLRVQRQDKPHILAAFSRIVPFIEQEILQHRLWIVEETRLRIRGE